MVILHCKLKALPYEAQMLIREGTKDRAVRNEGKGRIARRA
jgi:hypothetical protein